MKIQFVEYDGCFSLEMEAENMAEAAALTRFGMNRTNEIRSANLSVFKDGQFNSHIVFGKHKRADATVPRRK